MELPQIWSEAQALSEIIAVGRPLPEWMRQRLLILDGKARWDDFSIKDRTCKGWLLPYLMGVDEMFLGRWDYWSKTVANGKPLDEPIPWIEFDSSPAQEAMKNLQDCLTRYGHHGFSLNDFLAWLLWGFGEGEKRPAIADDVNEHWYRTFNLGLMLKYPYDYFGDIMCEKKAGFWNNPHAFYPTPHNVCEMMVRMQFEREGDSFRNKSACDPCVGTGRMLLHASNYSFHLFGQDIDISCVMACKINGYFYVPWLVRPALKPDRVPQASGDESAAAVSDKKSPAPVEVIEVEPEARTEFRKDKSGQLLLF